MPNAGDELHHLGWNACSSALCPWAPHPHVERRYLLLPGMRSSRIHVVDVKEDPYQPRLVKVVEPGELARKTGYSRPHTVHCGPGGIYVSALGDATGGGPGGVALLDHESFEPRDRWEDDRGSQRYAYDVWWNIGYGTVVTSEWGTPDMVEGGFDLDRLLARGYGRRLNVWDWRRRRHTGSIDLDGEQCVLAVMPAHDPTRPYGFVSTLASADDLSASVWLWELQGAGRATARKVISIPAEPSREKELLPEVLQPVGMTPPFVIDLTLSLDDRWLYVTAWGTGEVRRYDVSDPRRPRLTATVRLGGITRWAPHPAAGPLNGGPQMSELSRDGRRLYVTNSFYSSWDEQIYPEGIDGWLVLVHAREDGSMRVDPNFFVAFTGERPHQVRLAGGDSSSDSFCFPS